MIPFQDHALSREIELSELEKHKTENDFWLAIDEKVYDLTGFLAMRFPYLDKKKIPSSFPRPCTHLEAEVPDLEPLRLQGLKRVHLALVALQLSGSLG